MVTWRPAFCLLVQQLALMFLCPLLSLSLSLSSLFPSLCCKEFATSQGYPQNRTKHTNPPLSLYILYTADKTTNVVRALTITQPSQHARLISTLDILTDTPHQNFVIKLLYGSFWKVCVVAPPKVWFLTNLIFEAACGRPLASYKWWELMGG